MGLNSFQTSGNSPGDYRIGILGFGAVGSAVARRLAGPDPVPHLHPTHIADRRANDKRIRLTDALATLTWCSVSAALDSPKISRSGPPV